MFQELNGVQLKPVFNDEGVSCYTLDGGDLQNRYYICSEASTRHLLNTPEVVGYEVYASLLKATSRMMRMFDQEGKVSNANILSILRGALNYPLEESCYRENINVHDISFLSCERVFSGGRVTGLDVKYSKLATVPESTLLIGDIVASGDTMIHCLKYVFDAYKEKGTKLRNIIFFTIGGTLGIRIMEKLTKEIREFWPDFEGFYTVYYEGIFSCYDDGGLLGFQVPLVDFIWRDGVLAPEYREETLKHRDTLFEKCIIYDGGARRYEIAEHIEEVLDYWYELKEKADSVDRKALMDERLGYETPIDLEGWIHANHYEQLDPEVCSRLYEQEKAYIESLENVTLKEIAETRIAEFEAALKHYCL